LSPAVHEGAAPFHGLVVRFADLQERPDADPLSNRLAGATDDTLLEKLELQCSDPRCGMSR
jgi:hypothetical protein